MTSMLSTSSTSDTRDDDPASQYSVDLGNLITSAGGSLTCLKQLVDHLDDTKKFQFLTAHSKPAPSDALHSHSVTKQGKTWKVSFQLNWVE
jgi:hypothetical protein